MYRAAERVSAELVDQDPRAGIEPTSLMVCPYAVVARTEKVTGIEAGVVHAEEDVEVLVVKISDDEVEVDTFEAVDVDDVEPKKGVNNI